MKKIKNISLLTLTIAVFFHSTSEANACSCVGERPPCEAVSGASSVFVGKVIGAAQQNEVVNKDGSKTVYDVGAIRFAVLETFIGVKDMEIVIHSGTGGGDCGYWFKRNETYLVYAYGKSDHLSTNICTRIRPLNKAEEDLAFLRHLPTRGAGGTLYGTISQYSGDLEHGPSKLVGPMVGVKVMIEGDNRRFEVTTDAEGRYQVTGLPPGSYTVKPEIPDNMGAISQYDTVDRFGSYSGHKKIKVSDRACTRNNFTVMLDGRIGGRIIDAQGEPVKGMKVDLVLADSPEKDWSAWSDEEGRYEFRMVQPGFYLLGINLTWVPKLEYPYPRTYYPGANDSSQAAIIPMEGGAKFDGYDIVLPPRFTERILKGVVVWSDGRSAIEALVVFELADYPGKSLSDGIKVDDKGTFSIKLLDGLSYLLYARSPIANSKNKYMHSEPIEVTLVEDTEAIKLILTRPGSGYENSRILRKKKPE